MTCRVHDGATSVLALHYVHASPPISLADACNMRKDRRLQSHFINHMETLLEPIWFTFHNLFLRRDNKWSLDMLLFMHIHALHS